MRSRILNGYCDVLCYREQGARDLIQATKRKEYLSVLSGVSPSREQLYIHASMLVNMIQRHVT